MTDAGQSDQVHPERLNEQTADQPREHEHEEQGDEVAGRGGALHRLATDEGSGGTSGGEAA